MCGICVTLSACPGQDISEIHKELLQHRGPDASTKVHVMLTQGITACFQGYTLHFRGDLTPQPIQHASGDLLLWNGEIFGGITVEPGQNDGHVLLLMLVKCSTTEEILQTLAGIEGPWAFVYFQRASRKLWFGRDIFGRRSLLYHSDDEGKEFALSSVCIHTMKPWREVPASGVYCGQLAEDCNGSSIIQDITMYCWAEPKGSTVSSGVIDLADCGVFNNTLQQDSHWGNIPVKVSNDCMMPCISRFNDAVPEGSQSGAAAVGDGPALDLLTAVGDQEMLELADRLLHVLGQAVRTRVQCQSHLCHVCIQRHLVRARGSAEAAGRSDCDEDIAADTTNVGQETCVKRVPLTDASPSTDPGLRSEHCSHARVAVLFSGGVDSLVIAALADRFLPESEPIDLVNVAFEQRVKPQASSKNTKNAAAKAAVDTQQTDRDPYGVPDRLTGLQGLALLNPLRPWNFVQVNVTLKELQEARNSCVGSLVYPSNTVLDDSIGCAVWFAARGRGVISTPEGGQQSYTSTARVVLVGMGADEQLAGYSRHRVKYSTEGWPGLIQEIKMEIERISSRNLGRDDRIISDHAREARFPFLDESVVSFLNSLPMCKKAKLDLPRGYGEKVLLRLAAVKLGLGKSATLPKRAIQFGSRIAKLENRKEKAGDACQRLELDS